MNWTSKSFLMDVNRIGKFFRRAFGYSLPFCSFLFFTGSTCTVAKPSKPNVLFILSDDQGWGDLAAHGNPVLRTPNLDALFGGGLEFERFFVSPLCAPTRASLLTGRYHLRTGVTSVANGFENMNSDETTLAELFKSNGYSTGCFGKWHNGSHFPHRPTDQGFDEFIGFCAGHLTNYFDADLDSITTPIPSKGFITDVLTDRALSFIDRKKNSPFFCYVPFNAPHSPFQVPDPYFQKYKKEGMGDEIAAVYGMVDNMDENIGRLMKKLEMEKLLDNTIVIFMSDNGPNGVRFNGGMKGIKGQVDEGGVRVPAVISWKGKIKSGKKINRPAAHIDWFPTLTRLCGLKNISHKALDGMDLSDDILNDPSHFPSRLIFTHVAFLDKNLKNTPGAVRTSTHRLIIRDTTLEYYDLIHDPAQKINLTSAEYALTDSLSRLYDHWFLECTSAYQAIKPISVNTRQIILPAYESQFTGQLRFAEGHGWAHDWLEHWQTSADTISWLLTSDTTRMFTIYLRYTCPPDELGSVVAVEIDNQRIHAVIEQAFNPPLLPSPDRVKRKEAYEKEWAIMELGNISVPKGEHWIKIFPVSVPHGQVAEISALELDQFSPIK